MPKNEDGEFELIVGNKQLLSIVFILMVLFGVVFSMGYFLGRANSGTDVAAASTPSAPTSTQGRPDAAGRKSESKPMPSEGDLQPGDAKIATPEAGSTTAPVTSAAASTPVESAPAEPAPAPPPRQEPKPAPPVKHSDPPAPAPAAADGTPTPGQTYLQVAALKKPQAQLLVEVLKERGYHAVMAPIEGQDVFRILVGPVGSGAELAKIKTGLEGLGLGIKSIVRKY